MMSPHRRRRPAIDRHIDINEGSVSFRIRPGTVDFSDGQNVVFWTGSPKGGELRVEKDASGQVTFTHLKHGEGRVVAAAQVPLSDPTAGCRVGASWNVSEGTLHLYLDEVKVATESIPYA